MPEMKDTNEIYKLVNNPEKYLKELEEKKESVKKDIASKLPDNLKPYMEGNTGDIVLFVLVMFLIILFLKVINMALKVILNIVGIASILFVVYLLFKHFTGNS
jgi:hypothetical protein